MSQPSLSQSIAALESAVGTLLVERTTRRVMLTPAGERLLPHARSVLDALDAFEDACDLAREPLTGDLRLGVIPTVAPYFLPAALRATRRWTPELNLRVREDQTARLLAALRDGDLHVAVVALPVAEPGLEEVPLYREDFVLVVPPDHPWAGRTDLPPASLGDARPLLLLDEGHCLRDQALEVCRNAGVDAPDDGTARATSLATVVQLVAGGLGATLLPDTAVPVETRRGGLAAARFAAPAPGRVVGMAFRSASARGDEFDHLAAVLRRAVVSARMPAVVTGPVWGRPAS